MFDSYNLQMPSINPDPKVLCVSVKLPDVECDFLVIPVFENDELLDLDGLDSASGGELSRARATREFSAKPNSMFVTPMNSSNWKTKRVALVGVGPEGKNTVDNYRKAASIAVRSACQQRMQSVAFVLRGNVPLDSAAQAVSEGLVLGGFSDRRFKTKDEETLTPVKAFQIVLTEGSTSELTRSVDIGWTVAEATNRARELANTPGNILTPRIFAEQASSLVIDSGIAVELLDEAAIESQGMGLLLGVARGSVEPPRLIVMRHEPENATEGPVLGLIGKGVTFDSGGISLKPANGMERMKEDMAGGAAVVCAMRAIGALGLPRRVIGIVPATENMPGGRAIKPGDVLTSANGKTIEVVNTDAEGRLILGDALWYAQKQGVTHLVDVATLTGACVIALGNVASGLFGSPSSWIETVSQAANRAGERVWPMPIYEEYHEQLRSEIADLSNIGGREAGACTAAAFLSSFVKGIPWAHFDIAGTAWFDNKQSEQDKGSTGVMVRTLTELARAI